MKKLFNTYQIILFVLTVAIVNSGCKKLLEVPAPSNEMPIALTFQDSVSATAAINGIYARAANYPGFSHGDFENGGIMLYNTLSSDELASVGGVSPYETATLNATTPNNAGSWVQAYETMLQINQCIDGLTKSGKLSKALYNQLLGECYFDRAFWYYYIYQFYGTGAALATTADLKLNVGIANNNTQADFYNQMATDLQKAEELMTDNYISAEKARPNRKAASALLARIYLYQGNFQGAIDEATKVISSNLYPLESIQAGAVANAPFKKGSAETIWQIRPNALSEGPLGFGSIPDAANFPFFANPAFSPPNYLLRSGFINSFDKSNDLRYQKWIVDVLYKPFGATDYAHYFIPRKYTQFAPTTAPTEYYIGLRSAEVYLIRAEAYTKQNNIAAAVADLNVIRRRAFVNGYAGTDLSAAGMSAAACMTAVQLENQHEYFCEWGHRWADLKRWPGVNNTSVSLADELLPAIKPNWKATQKVYPVPQAELQADANLKQNPGY